jgi:hypothetical protein
MTFRALQARVEQLADDHDGGESRQDIERILFSTVRKLVDPSRMR